MSSKRLSLGFTVFGGIALAACDHSAPSSKYESSIPRSIPQGPASSEEPSGGQSDSFGDATRGGEETNPDDLARCATRTATAEPKAVYLVFMFDKSGSMSAYDSPKWSSAKAASKTFFESPESKGVSASLAFFPDNEAYSCDVSA